jgi:hypothetical protein
VLCFRDAPTDPLLEFSFETKALRTLCEDEDVATAALGPAVARALLNRLADLRAAGNILELPIGHPFAPDPKNRNVLAIDLGEGQLLTFSSGHRKVPLLESGEVDWERVNRVKIRQVGDSHE